jgi:hypothetical protein
VEFRPCELQISDFENAAVVCFVVLLTRAILSYKWNLLMPISLGIPLTYIHFIMSKPVAPVFKFS